MTGSLDAPQSLSDALARCNVDEIKRYLALLSSEPMPTRKAELVAATLRCLEGEAALRSVLERLEPLQREALAFALYRHDGTFRAPAFEARHGALPAFGISDSSRSSIRPQHPNLLSLLFGAGSRTIPADLCRRLKPLLSAPEPMALPIVDTLPDRLGDAALTVRCCEYEALTDLAIVLRLVEAGRLQVGEKTGVASAGTQALLVQQLSGGDYYPQVAKRNKWDQQVGPIKAFAWPLLLQTGKLAARHGNRLAPTAAGRSAPGKPADALRRLWQAWMKSGAIDEFSRVDVIKGQSSRGRVMAAVAPRRATVAAALSQCPVGAWVELDALARYMQAEDLEFEVCLDPWKLYLVELRYGSLGYQGSHDWNLLQLRYLLCLLFEYAAPLGLVDIAYTEPAGARPDFHDLWGAEELEFLSRYDGLRYLRLTPLGAYCLGVLDAYEPKLPASSLRLTVLPSGRIAVAAGTPGAEERLLLDTWTESDGEDTWRVDRSKLLMAIEQGQDAQVFQRFLAERDDQPLPEPVEAMLRDAVHRGRALKPVGQALLIECDSAETAATIASHALTAALCLRAGERRLVLQPKDEKAFRSALRMLGFGMAL